MKQKALNTELISKEEAGTFFNLYPNRIPSSSEVEQYINQAISLDYPTLFTIDPLLILNISELHPVYRTLIIDTKLNFFRSTYSIHKITRDFFSHFGLSYKLFNDFLKNKLNQHKHIYPFVLGKRIFLKIKGWHGRTENWLNLTSCIETYFTPEVMQKALNKLKRTFTHPEGEQLLKVLPKQNAELIFDYQSNKYAGLSVHIEEDTHKLIEQIKYANQLLQSWCNYCERACFNTCSANIDSHPRARIYKVAHVLNDEIVSPLLNAAEIEVLKIMQNILDFLGNRKVNKMELNYAMKFLKMLDRSIDPHLIKEALAYHQAIFE